MSCKLRTVQSNCQNLRCAFKNRIALINEETVKIWLGNTTIHFKKDEKNRLKLEELVSKLTDSCSIPEVGFGRVEQFAEKNYNYIWVRMQTWNNSPSLEGKYSEHKSTRRAGHAASRSSCRLIVARSGELSRSFCLFVCHGCHPDVIYCMLVGEGLVRSSVARSGELSWSFSVCLSRTSRDFIVWEPDENEQHWSARVKAHRKEWRLTDELNPEGTQTPADKISGRPSLYPSETNIYTIAHGLTTRSKIPVCITKSGLRKRWQPSIASRKTCAIIIVSFVKKHGRNLLTWGASKTRSRVDYILPTTT